MRRERQLFVAASFREANVWASAWGYSPGEWRWVGRIDHALGLHNTSGAIVYVCGSGDLERDLVTYLESAGFDEFVDAHDLDTWHEPRSALDLLRPAMLR